MRRRCPDCKSLLSIRATACPNCGAPVLQPSGAELAKQRRFHSTSVALICAGVAGVGLGAEFAPAIALLGLGAAAVGFFMFLGSSIR